LHVQRIKLLNPRGNTKPNQQQNIAGMVLGGRLGASLTCFGYVLFVTLAAHRAHEARTCGSTSFSSFQSIFLPVKTKQLLEKAETALCTL
jgi:hypothetical protein